MTRLSAAEARPDVVARMNHLFRASPKTGMRMSTSKISAAPAEPGHNLSHSASVLALLAAFLSAATNMASARKNQ